ncbi:MAG: 50S ribosomal protein L10 [Caldiserica bacterium]|nr:MAG: 50S ribosomal protein L10 [Caldisericota bacterium]
MVKLKREEKKSFVKNLLKELEGKGIVLTNFQGLNSEEINELRRGIKENGGRYKVIKNIFLSMIFEKMKIEELKNFLVGPTGVLIMEDDYIKPIKFAVKFSKDHENFKIKGGYIENRVVGYDEIVEISKLPSREELLSMLVGALKAPIAKLSFVLKGVILKLLYALKEVEKKKEEK